MDIIKEEWKPVVNYEGRYEVSNLGNVRSLNTVSKNGRIKIGKIKLLCSDNNGYLVVSLNKNDISLRVRVHRLVAIAFLPNPNNYREVNHKDLDKSNNNLSNLEWCTHEQNMSHADKTLGFSKNLVWGSPYRVDVSKAILQYTKDGIFVREYKSAAEAERITGIGRKNISNILRENRRTAGGFIWKYKNNKDE